ncbi:MAG: hypothetical protein M3N13_03840 [Candidatus Eremiobacteraeota bacterium]|nr:hypothetical protein [Candidatus Eremiobacteraeota bacterium]
MRLPGSLPSAGVAIGLWLVVMEGAGAPAAAANGCSTDTFSIEGRSVGIELCAARTSLVETLSAPGQESYVRRLALDADGGGEGGRTIDDVALSRLGIAKTLHLTIAYKPGHVRLEHALLVPGALSLK